MDLYDKLETQRRSIDNMLRSGNASTAELRDALDDLEHAKSEVEDLVEEYEEVERLVSDELDERQEKIDAASDALAELGRIQANMQTIDDTLDSVGLKGEGDGQIDLAHEFAAMHAILEKLGAQLRKLGGE